MVRPKYLKDLIYAAKKIVNKQTIKKIMAIHDETERAILFEYSVKSALELKYAELKERIKKAEESGRDVFILLTKIHFLGSKVHFFNASFYKKDFKSIMKLFKEIEVGMR